MTAIKPLLVAGGALSAILALSASRRPAALAETTGGLWEISGTPGSRYPLRQCIADPVLLSQFEHRGKPCTRLVISDSPPSTVIHYTCAGGGFGRSKMTVITPRSIRVETQGISGDLPFNYVIQARRVGDCPVAVRH